MLRATAVHPAPTADAIDTVTLDFDERHRRRLVLVGEAGTSFLLDLADTPALKTGDGLVLEDGRVITVAARAERLAEFTITDPVKLARIAWHLGNRHTPTQVMATGVRIRDDYVLVELAKKLGVDGIRFVVEPFEPEGGAYGHGATMAHDHAPAPVAIPKPGAKAHGHDHGHGHGHGHDHGHDHGHGHDHSHGHDHKHDHDHGHKHAHGHDHHHGPGCGCGHEH